MDAWAVQFANLSKVSPFEGPQYHLAPKWAFYLQAAFMGMVFFVGTPLNAIVLFVTMKYKKLRQPLNYILVNISLAGFIFDTFSVSQVFVSALRGYYFLGPTLCALEAAMGATAGKMESLQTLNGIDFALLKINVLMVSMVPWRTFDVHGTFPIHKTHFIAENEFQIQTKFFETFIFYQISVLMIVLFLQVLWRDGLWPF